MHSAVGISAVHGGEDVKTALPPRALVVDTNVVLDLFVFRDPGADAVGAAAISPQWLWVGSQAMRDELQQVLAYTQIAARMVSCGNTAMQVLAQYDARIRLVDAAPRSSTRCQDPDDQIFIDLAVQHRAALVSKDKAILNLKKRLAPLGVRALTAQEFSALARGD